MVVIFQRVPGIKIILPGFRGDGDPGQGGGVRVLDREIFVQRVSGPETVRLELVMTRHHTDRHERFMLRGIEPDPIDVPVSVCRGQHAAVDDSVRVDAAGFFDRRVEHDLRRRRHRLVRARGNGRVEAGHVGEHDPVDRDGCAGMQRVGKQRQPGGSNYTIRHIFLHVDKGGPGDIPPAA